MSVPSPELEEIIQNIKDDCIANIKGWQGSSYEALKALQAYAQTQRIQGAIAELKLIPHWRDGVFINDGMAEDSYYFKRLAELNDQENNHE